MTTTQAAPGTAALWDVMQQWEASTAARLEQRATQGERVRAMLLCWVDEYERELGYGGLGRPPRTAQIRQWYRQQGPPAQRRGGTQRGDDVRA